MMIVTGAASFLGSCLISRLNQENFNYIIAADNFDHPEKERNLYHKTVFQQLPYDRLFYWLDQHYQEVEFIFHLDSNIKPFDNQDDTNENASLDFNKIIWQKCVNCQIPLLITLETLKQNKDAESVRSFKQWATTQEKQPFFWAGIELPEVYGPNEYYKGQQASIIYRKYQQWKNADAGKKIPVENHPPRALLYIKDLLDVVLYLMHHRKDSGIYSLGTDKLYTEQEIARALASSLEIKSNLENKAETEPHINKPAYLAKLRSIGYDTPLTSLEDGIRDYVHHYLKESRYL